MTKITLSSIKPDEFLEIPQNKKLLVKQDMSQPVLFAAGVVDNAVSATGYYSEAPPPPLKVAGSLQQSPLIRYQSNIDAVADYFTNVPKGYTGLVVVFFEERSHAPPRPQYYGSRNRNDTLGTLNDPISRAYRSWHLVRFQDGKISSDYAPAIQSLLLSYNGSNGGSNSPEDLNWYAYDIESRYVYKGVRLPSKKAWKQTVDTGLLDGTAPKALTSRRIKLDGVIRLGENLVGFGHNGKILGVIVGSEVHVLDRPYREGNTEGRMIGRFVNSLMDNPPTEKDQDRWYFNSAQELEELLTGNLSFMLGTVTPT